MLNLGLGCMIAALGTWANECEARVAERNEELRRIIIGTWTGGAMFGPPLHEFKQDGTYRMTRRPSGDVFEGKWRLEGSELTRTHSGNSTSVNIVRFDECFFQIQTSTGGMWGYQRQRYDEELGRHRMWFNSIHDPIEVQR